MFMPIPYLIGGGGGPVSLSYEDQGTTSSSGTIAGLSFGAADANRSLIVGAFVNAFSSSAITDVTIGGVTADLYAAASSGNLQMCIAVADVPTGTSGTVDITDNGVFTSSSACVVWSALNLTSTVPIEADTLVSTSTSLTITLTGDASTDVAFVGYCYSGSTFAKSWDAPLTEHFDINNYGAASVLQTAATEDVVLNQGRPDTKILVAASFK